MTEKKSVIEDATTASHTHAWLHVDGGFICNVPGCGQRCEAAPRAELDAANERLRVLTQVRAGREQLDILGAGDYAKVAAATCEELATRHDADVSVVLIFRREGAQYGVSAFAPDVAIEVVMAQVMEGLVVLRRRAHESQSGKVMG